MMELKSISYLESEATSAFLEEYVEYLVNSFGWEEPKIRLAINELHNLPNDTHCADIMYRALIAFLVENYENVSYSISGADTPFTCDPSMVFFEWTFNSVTHNLAMSEEDAQRLKTIILMLDTGMSNEVSYQPIESLQQENAWSNWLTHLMNFGLAGENPVIPVPSDTLDIDESTARFSSAIWYDSIQEKRITLAGLGGIGSYVGFLLSRMKPNEIFLYDDDRVETVNMSGQLYGYSDVTKYKVDALSEMMRNYSSYHNALCIRSRFTEDSDATRIMICGFDSMEARRLFFDKWESYVDYIQEDDVSKCLFIDGRLAAEEFQVFCITGDDTYNRTRYREQFLFSDEEADETLCSYKQTSYMANMIGSIIVNLFVNFVANSLVENLRDLPFLTSYSGDSMMFKTEN